jgi:hypothetical protein
MARTAGGFRILRRPNNTPRDDAFLFYFLPRRAASAAIKRSSQSASDRASFCASCSAIVLTDGFMRAPIATVRAFGFGFFIG